MKVFLGLALLIYAFSLYVKHASPDMNLFEKGSTFNPKSDEEEKFDQMVADFEKSYTEWMNRAPGYQSGSYADKLRDTKGRIGTVHGMLQRLTDIEREHQESFKPIDTAPYRAALQRQEAAIQMQIDALEQLAHQEQEYQQQRRNIEYQLQTQQQQ